MKPLPAVGLASSLVQILDFSIKCTRKDHNVFHPTEGEAVGNHTVLQDVANNLFRLSVKIDQSDLKKLSSGPKHGKLSEPAEHLLKISGEVKEQVTLLIDAVIQAQARGSFGDPKWLTIRDSLSGVWKKKEITTIKKKFRAFRKEVETALLLALQQYLDQSAETGLPVFAEGYQIDHVEKWQNEAMDAVHSKGWSAKKKKDMEEFSTLVDKLIQAENEAVFCKDIFDWLHFPVLDDRLQSIPAAQDGTFEWIFEPLVGDSQGQQKSSLVEWLGSTSGQNLFWITGKPGSGKSTLMKLLLRNSRLFPSLEAWSGASPGITAGFYFWNCGTELQTSSSGLLRSLLWESLQDMIYGPLQKDPGIVQWLFADRWQQFGSYGGGAYHFTFPELRRAFDLMISDISKKFLFLIDGLDELDGYPEAVVELLTTTVKRDNVKIVTSSRALPGFQNAFEKQPTLNIDDLADNDIKSVVLSLFNQDDSLAKIRTQQADNKQESNIIGDIAYKATGSFLWATLSTQFLLQELDHTDDFHSLQARVEALPDNIEALLSHIFQSLDDNDRRQASRLIRLVHAHGYPSLLGLSFANDADPKSSISAAMRPLKSAELTKRIEDICSLLRLQAQNFLSMFEATPESSTSADDEDVQYGPEYLKVNFAHRCIKDFIQKGPIWEQILQNTGYDSFDPNEHWANASLWALKTKRPQHGVLVVWEDLAWCIEYALRLEEKDKKVRVTYLDEVAKAAVNERQDYVKSIERATDLPEGGPIESFLDIAVWLNLSGYVSIKAKTAERKELRHAVEYFKVMRKRLGTGGEGRWIGERKRLRALYESPTPELHLLLEYYSKVVRFATPKPHVDIPESV